MYATGVIGDSRWPKYHPNTTQRLPHYTNPPKILCAAFQMQYHEPNGLMNPRRNGTTQDSLFNETNENTLHYLKQCHK